MEAWWRCNGFRYTHWYFLFPKGNHNDDSCPGVAVDASTVAVFQDTIRLGEFLGRPSADEIERAVTVHEAATYLAGKFSINHQLTMKIQTTWSLK